MVVTDRNPLTYLKLQQNLSRRQARWLEYLEQTFVYSWEYHPGRSSVADPFELDQRTVMLALLTSSASNMIQRSVRARIVLGDPTMEKTRDRRSLHEFDYDLLTMIIAGYALDPWFKNPVNLENLALKNVIWWYQDAIVVPMVESLCNDIFIECHDTVYSRHMAISKTLKLVERNFWWPI